MFTEQCEAAVVREVSETMSEEVGETGKHFEKTEPDMHLAAAHDDMTQVGSQGDTFHRY